MVRFLKDVPTYTVDDEPGADGVYEATTESPQEPRRQPRSKPEQPSTVREREDQAARERAAAAHAFADYARAVEADEAVRLLQETRTHEQALMMGLRKSGIVAMHPDKQVDELNSWQKAYVMSMVTTMVRPLRGGMKGDTLARTVGMGTAMLLLSPNFRKEVGTQLNDVHSSIMERIARRGERKARAAQHRFETTGAEISKRDLARLERIQRLERHGLEPLDARTAALMEVGIAESAYWEMRAPGADIEAISASHQRVLSELYSMAERDGVRPHEISQQMRDVVSKRMSNEPHLAQVFSGLAHGQFRRNDRGQVFEASSGHLVDKGSFLIRTPQQSSEHSAQMTTAMVGDLERSFRTDPNSFVATMGAYSAGLLSSELSVPSPRSGGPETQIFDTARGMFVAMVDDGLPVEEARMAYVEAVIEAGDEMARRHPECALQWGSVEGERFRAQVREWGVNFDSYAYQAVDHADARRDEAEAQMDDFEWAEPVVDDDPVREQAGSASPRESRASESAFTTPDYEAFGAVPASVVLLDSMSRFMGRDIAEAAHSGTDTDLGGNSWLARQVYGSPGAMGVFANGSFAEDLPLFALGDDVDAGDMRERGLAMVTMREEMERLGLPASQQDEMFSAAYVRALELNVLFDARYEQVVRTAGAMQSPSWQESVFALTMARTHTGSASTSYHSLIRSYGLDPDLLDDVVASTPMNYAQAQETMSQLSASSGPQSAVSTPGLPEEERRRRRRQSNIRGEINREYNAQGDNAQLLAPDPDAEFEYEL